MNYEEEIQKLIQEQILSHAIGDWDRYHEIFDEIDKLRRKQATEEVLNINYNQISNLIEDLFITAYEGGSNYWMKINKNDPFFTKELTYGEQIQKIHKRIYPSEYIIRKVMAGEKLAIYDRETNKLLGYLTKEGAFNAISIMQKDYPHQLLNIINENFDADDADAWLQVAVMGEAVYG